MKITFLLPGVGKNVPIGGFKVVYEYANRFASEGFDVHIIYICNPFTKKDRQLRMFIYNFAKFVYKHICGFSGKKWFQLDNRIKEHCVFTLSRKYVLNSDCCIATAVSTAMDLNELGLINKKLIYFIQGYEDWAIERTKLHETYAYKFDKIVISKELKGILEELGQESKIIPNGFDNKKFKYIKPIRSRNPLTLSMVYHENPNKGCEFGFKALEIVKRKYPNIRVILFGTSTRPLGIPVDYEYYKQPDDLTHLRINNESSIFIAPSLSEGWGLTIGEAMMCGEAVVCTNNGGYKELAIDNYNALISPIKDAESMAHNIILLIENNDLRFRIAESGLDSIKTFTWEKSYNEFKKTCLS